MTNVTSGRKPPRALLALFPERYALPARPANASSAVLDAFRQTNFLLAEDFALFERIINLQLSVVAANAKVRGPKAAALFSLWSRSFAHLTDVCALACCGSYASCPPLLRASLDSIAAQKSLIAGEFTEYEEWYETAVSQDRGLSATTIEVGRYRAASVLIDDERLGTLFRFLSDLSMPHFGTALFLAAPEISLQKAPLSFADSAFHLGWAELISAWLVLLAAVQLEAAKSSGIMTLNSTLAADCEAIQRDAEPLAQNKRRCYVEPNEDRFVFYNFRRTPTGQPKRVVLG